MFSYSTWIMQSLFMTQPFVILLRQPMMAKMWICAKLHQRKKQWHINCQPLYINKSQCS